MPTIGVELSTNNNGAEFPAIQISPAGPEAIAVATSWLPESIIRSQARVPEISIAWSKISDV